MANTLQSRKRIRQNEKSHLRNRSRLSQLRSQIKRFAAAIAARNVDVAEREFRLVAKFLDKNARHNTIHKNAASRKKSRLQAMLNRARVEHGK
jgi:small subunit ribosomal protein S20